MNVQVTLTEKECQILKAILYDTVGGSTRGPRERVESIIKKLPYGCGKYSAAIEVINRMGSQAVVIREAK